MPGKGSSAGGADVRTNQQLQAAADQHLGNYDRRSLNPEIAQALAQTNRNNKLPVHQQQRITVRGLSIN